MRISVIIPALNEAEAIDASLQALPRRDDVEIVVVDGGSTDETRRIAESRGARVIAAQRGRGPQMNAGARAATGDVLFFVHADTRLPAAAYDAIEAALEDESVPGGAFHLAIDGQGWFYGFTARNANIRSRIAGAPYGDQAFFVRRADFEALGGYRDLVYCEDLDFIRRLRRRGRVVLLPFAVFTSARRWQKHGRLRITVRNGLLFARYWLGLLRERPPAAPL